MDGFYKVTVRLAAITALPEDSCENTFFFESNTGTGNDFDDDANIIAPLLTAFYNAVPTGGTNDIASYIGDQISRVSNACQMLFYFDAGPGVPLLWGSPVATRSWTLDAGLTGVSLPAEVAVVLSFHGDLTGIPETAPNPTPPPAVVRPAARRKGRVYIGPLLENALFAVPSTGEPVPTVFLRDALTGSGSDLKADAAAIGSWVVASKTDDAYYPVAGGWVDYAFDTQRRRGQDPTNRTVWT